MMKTTLTLMTCTLILLAGCTAPDAVSTNVLVDEAGHVDFASGEQPHEATFQFQAAAPTKVTATVTWEDAESRFHAYIADQAGDDAGVEEGDSGQLTFEVALEDPGTYTLHVVSTHAQDEDFHVRLTSS